MDDHRPPAEAPGLADPAALPPLPDGFVPLCLVLQPGGNAIVLDRPDVLVGRHSGADLRLPLPDISRRHCRIVFADGEWEVHDLKSLNGIFVNDLPVTRSALHPGDTLRVGGFTFEVRPAGPPDALLRVCRALPEPPDTPPLRRAS
jgi:hypothetical protein